jgi:hypothetical protein
MPRRPRPVFSLDSAMVTTVESRSHGVNEDSCATTQVGWPVMAMEFRGWRQGDSQDQLHV